MESIMRGSEFAIQQRRIAREGGKQTYEPVLLIKGQDIDEKTFDTITRAMAGVLPEDHVAGKPAIRIGLRVNDGKREFLGVVISEEGDYKGKRTHLGEFKHRAADIHVSKDDSHATHERITYGVPREDVRNELVRILNEKFSKKIE